MKKTCLETVFFLGTVLTVCLGDNYSINGAAELLRSLFKNRSNPTGLFFLLSWKKNPYFFFILLLLMPYLAGFFFLMHRFGGLVVMWCDSYTGKSCREVDKGRGTFSFNYPTTWLFFLYRKQGGFLSP